MEQENDKAASKKLSQLIDLFKNVKFIAFNVIVFAMLGFALISGDGEKIVLNLYKSVTGQEYAKYSPVEDSSNADYLVLKDKLSRDKAVKIENVDVTIIAISDTSHKYRVVINGEPVFYKVAQQANGSWKIAEEK
jgi:hypothetical protein